MKSKIHELTKNNIMDVSKKAILLFLLAFTIGCEKNDDNNPSTNPIDQLPPMTTTGKNTIGCLVNGVPFTDSGIMNNFYQFVDGEYFLSINWEQGYPGNIKYGQIALRRIEVSEGETYNFKY